MVVPVSLVLEKAVRDPQLLVPRDINELWSHSNLVTAFDYLISVVSRSYQNFWSQSGRQIPGGRQTILVGNETEPYTPCSFRWPLRLRRQRDSLSLSQGPLNHQMAYKIRNNEQVHTPILRTAPGWPNSRIVVLDIGIIGYRVIRLKEVKRKITSRSSQTVICSFHAW